MAPAGEQGTRVVISPDRVSLDSSRGRWILLATVLGSGVALLDATVVNVALPAIGRDLDASFGTLQWTVNGYTLIDCQCNDNPHAPGGQVAEPRIPCDLT